MFKFWGRAGRDGKNHSIFLYFGIYSVTVLKGWLFVHKIWTQWDKIQSWIWRQLEQSVKKVIKAKDDTCVTIWYPKSMSQCQYFEEYYCSYWLTKQELLGCSIGMRMRQLYTQIFPCQVTMHTGEKLCCHGWHSLVGFLLFINCNSDVTTVMWLLVICQRIFCSRIVNVLNNSVQKDRKTDLFKRTVLYSCCFRVEVMTSNFQLSVVANKHCSKIFCWYSQSYMSSLYGYTEFDVGC